MQFVCQAIVVLHQLSFDFSDSFSQTEIDSGTLYRVLFNLWFVYRRSLFVSSFLVLSIFRLFALKL